MFHRDATIAEYQSRILKVQLYLQGNLDESVELEQLARMACFSPFHFHRIFSAFVGESLFQYIRRLRLERAARWLLNSDDSITDIALQSGYETPAAFGKAFKKLFQQSPKQFREERLALQLEHKQTFLLLGKGEPMTPTILNRPEQRVLFVRKTGGYNDSAREAWTSLYTYAHQHGLQVAPPNMLGISHDSPGVTQESHLRYDACIPVEDDVKGEGEVGVQTIQGGKYAKFLHKGAYATLSYTYQAIFSQWLPTSQESLRDTPCFEVYLNDMSNTAPNDLETEIYIPLQ